MNKRMNRRTERRTQNDENRYNSAMKNPRPPTTLKTRSFTRTHKEGLTSLIDGKTNTRNVLKDRIQQTCCSLRVRVGPSGVIFEHKNAFHSATTLQEVATKCAEALGLCLTSSSSLIVPVLREKYTGAELLTTLTTARLVFPTTVVLCI